MDDSSELNETNELLRKHFLSAKELFRWRKKEKGSLPQRGGVKDFEPDDSWLQAKRLEAFYEEELFVLGEPRVEKSGNLVQGSWDEKIGLISIEKTAKFWMKMGFVENNHNWLYPEEALFLMEVNCLEVQHHGLSLSLQEAYNLFLCPNTTVSLEEYQVYAHLRRLGYVVLRHSGKLESTPYERKIKLDKHCTKKKRKHDRSKQGLGEPVCIHTAAEPSDAQYALKNNASRISSGSFVNVTHCRQEALKNTLEEEVIALDHNTCGSKNDMSVNCVCEGVNSSVACNVDITKRCEEVHTIVECSVDITKINHWKGDVSICFEDATSRVHLTNHQGSSSEKITGAGDECDEPVFKRQKLEKSFEYDDGLSKADSATDPWTLATLKSHMKQADCSDSCKYSNWNFKQIQFPCIAEKDTVVLSVPAPHLLPQNIELNEDFDDVCMFDADEYRRQRENCSWSASDHRDSYSHLVHLKFSYADWLQKHSTPVQASNWGEWKREMLKQMDLSSLTSPVSHLWQEEVTPLLHPEDATSTYAVLNRLSIIQPFQESFEGKQSNPVKLSFDVYLPNTTFKKTSPGLPDHRICVSRCLQPPDPLQLQSAVAYLSDNVPLHWAVVISGEISFFVFENITLPVNPSSLG